MNFNIRQKKVIEAKESKILCLACAAAGKTTTLTERVRRLIKNGCPTDKIACITFTTAAAEEMRQRLGEIAHGAYIGTIHGLANNICVSNGIDTEKYIANMNFNKIIEKAMTLPQSRFPKYEHVLVDEFQDTCDFEYRFIEKIPKNNFFACGDERQAIYGFKNATDQFLRELHDDPTCKTYYLIDNYRNTPDILEYADSLISSMQKISPKSVPAKVEKGYLQLRFSFYEALEHLEMSGDWGNWFILCRTNNELATAISILEERNIPYVSFKKADLDIEELSMIMKDNRVKVLTIHTSKGLQNKHVIVTGARMYNEDERKIAYVAATRAEQSLYQTPSICGRGYKHRPKNRDQASPGRIFEKSQKGMISFE